jgi:hypothetical protein
MKKNLKLTSMVAIVFAATVFLATSAQAQLILAGFDSPGGTEPDSTPDVFATGWTASITDGRAYSTNTGRNSTDGTFGTVAGAGGTLVTDFGSIDIVDSSAFGRRAVDFTLTNNTGASFDMTGSQFHFDYNPGISGSPDSLEITYAAGPSGDSLGATSVTLGTLSGLTTIGYVSYDFNIAGLDSLTLANGASAVFRIAADNLATESARGFLDNIAVSTVPEPSTYALIAGALALVSVMVRRRK